MTYGCPHTNVGDYIYISEGIYNSKTSYKVAYIKSPKEILVEVDLESNKPDLDIISGWYPTPRLAEEIYGKINNNKLYWWVMLWRKKYEVLENE